MVLFNIDVIEVLTETQLSKKVLERIKGYQVKDQAVVQ
jgi:hypothetical protein